jgi:hypothetical protein
MSALHLRQEQIVLDTKIYSGGAVVVNDNRWIYRPLPDNPKEAILECLTVPTLPAFQIKGTVSSPYSSLCDASIERERERKRTRETPHLPQDLSAFVRRTAH